MLIKHLDHKSVLKHPSMQLNILEVTSSLSENAKVEHSAAIVSAISDLMRHLRKCMHSSLDEANIGTDAANCIRMVSVAVDKCLVQLTKKVYFIILRASSSSIYSSLKRYVADLSIF